MTLNKKLSGDSPRYKKNNIYNSFLKKIIISLSMFLDSMDLRVFLVANPFRLNKKNKGHATPRNMGIVPTIHQVFTGYRTHADGNTNTTHLTLGVPTHKSPSVGEVGKQITTSYIQRVSQSTKGSALFYLKKRKKVQKKKRRKEKKKREREVSKEGSKSEPARSTRVKRLHVHCLQALALHRKSFCCIAPPILALAHACKASA